MREGRSDHADIPDHFDIAVMGSVLCRLTGGSIPRLSGAGGGYDPEVGQGKGDGGQQPKPRTVFTADQSLSQGLLAGAEALV